MTTKDATAALMELDSATRKLAAAIESADEPTPAPLYDRSKLGPLMTVKDAAQLISASPRTVRDLCAKGKITAVKLGRDWRVNTAAFLEQYGI